MILEDIKVVMDVGNCVYWVNSGYVVMCDCFG